MSDVIKYENTFKSRLKVFLKSKKTIILFVLIIFSVFATTGFVLINRKDKALESYDSHIDLATSNMPPKKASDYKKYDNLLEDYYSEKYQLVIDEAQKALNNGLSNELVSSYYYLIINSYIGLKDINSAEIAADNFKKTDSYQNIDQEAKNILEKIIEQAKTDLNKVKNENPTR